MSNYNQEGNRWTMILVRKHTPSGDVYERCTFDLVRFNVDVDPEAPTSIMPVVDDRGKLFERIWKVDEVPFKVQFFGGQE